MHDLRQWTDDVHRTVDDSPYGGGPGMVMRPEPWGRALDAVRPAGHPAGRAHAGRAAVHPGAGGAVGRPSPGLVFACGRYEGIDQRVADWAADAGPVSEVSIGDYVLAGGESAVLVMVEAVTRLLPGVVGNARVGRVRLARRRAARGPVLHPAGVLARPRGARRCCCRATTPRSPAGAAAQSLRRTADRRPDLLAALPDDALTDADRTVLDADG